MLEANKDRASLHSEVGRVTEDEPSAAELLAFARGIVRRQIFIFLLFALLGAGLGIVFFLRAVPTYTATTTLLIATQRLDVFQQPAIANEMNIQDMGAMESQVEFLKSDQVALAVIEKLRLWQDPRFVWTGKPGFLSASLQRYFPALFPERPPPTDEERMQNALHLFARSLTVNRVGITYAIEIGFESTYPQLAAKIANAVADRYIELHRSSEYDAAQRAIVWLEARIPDLRAKSEAAQRAVLEYKNEHNFVETGGGQLINDQRLADLTAKLYAAHDETLRAKSRLDQLTAISDKGLTSSTKVLAAMVQKTIC